MILISKGAKRHRKYITAPVLYRTWLYNLCFWFLNKLHKQVYWKALQRFTSPLLYSTHHPSEPEVLIWPCGWLHVHQKFLFCHRWSQSRLWRWLLVHKTGPKKIIYFLREFFSSIQQNIQIFSFVDPTHVHKRTISNSRRTSFSDSPLYLEVRVEEDTLKKVVPHSVATALANMVFPVPGGPTINTPYDKMLHIVKT